MSHDPRNTDDKFELHYRQQLSALVDGELAPDEARFLLRRLEHDTELSGRFERWQLCGDVLRGQVRRSAGSDLAERIAAAVAAAPLTAEVAAPTAPQRRRQLWTRWGGGAALAASVAAVAMFVGRPAQTGPDFGPAPAVAVLPSTEAVLPETAAAPAATIARAVEAPAAARPAASRPASRQVASAPRPRRAATASATTPVSVPEPITAPLADAVAEAPAIATTLPALPADPFASAVPLEARPWPRAALPRTGSAYTASFGQAGGGSPFYPFEPSLAAPQASESAEEASLPEPPPQDLQR
ncbi:sigma-E factor negative regulatory protein [Pseudoxanthomonas suwonensis]|uniref:sigma-E factor negative regulatory protein n=1 Tax=Pseudoxanthomonas suwonensis TaxID=314722 RepID=UPI0004903E7F|nr:sigma-E factor negative regulatory protein [Pseudoxanthomonas suwonensis]